MKLIGYLLAAIIGFFGLMFVAGAQGQALRIVVGAVLLVAAGALIYLLRLRPQRVAQADLVQKIDLSGDVHLEQMECQSCGGNLSEDNISIKAGAVFVNCPYCGAAYQLEEEPKW